MNGFGSNAGLLPIGDANAIVVEMGKRDVLPVVSDTPVIAGVNGTDPTRVMRHFLGTLPGIGFSGVINFPSHGIIDGVWRESLEETGFGYDREVAMIAEAHSQDQFTLAYCFTPGEARAMVEAGVNVVVAHMGLTTGGSIGATKSGVKSMATCITLTRDIAAESRALRDDIVVLGHGGPIESPDQAGELMRGAGIEGFVGALHDGASAGRNRDRRHGARIQECRDRGLIHVPRRRCRHTRYERQAIRNPGGGVQGPRRDTDHN